MPKLDKFTRGVIDHLIDIAKRGEARESATLQDADLNHSSTTRHDINSYGGGPAAIRDVCHIQKRKVR